MWRAIFKLNERMTKLEEQQTATDVRVSKLEAAWTRIVWQCQSVVRSVVKQFTGRKDD